MSVIFLTVRAMLASVLAFTRGIDTSQQTHKDYEQTTSCLSLMICCSRPML
jgi:hypothetical protein